MEEDLYSESETVTAVEEPPTPPEETEEETPADEAEESSLVPRSMFQKDDLKVGDTCTFKVVSIIEDEVEVAYSKSDKSDSKKELTAYEKLDGMAK